MTSETTLDNIALDSWYAKGVNAQMIHYTAKIFSRHMTRGNYLELGPAEGLLTECLQAWANEMTLVDGSSHFCAGLREKFPNARVIHAMFESFTSDDEFDIIVLGHVLEHVDDPVLILQRLRPLLKKGAKLLAAVPNSKSLHRQAAVIMELLDQESAMSAADIHHGHKRVYNPELFRQHFVDAGFTINVFGGYWLKPLSDKQLEQSWSPPMLDAFMQLGESYPEIAAENYIVATAEASDVEG